MTETHTQGLLKVCGVNIYAEDCTTFVATTVRGGYVAAKDDANARRIGACWNACDGMADPAAEIATLRAEVERLSALINNPQTEDFIQAVKAEAGHQVEKWGDAHDRNKSAESWFWLVGYLTGKCLRSCIAGDTFKAKHHTISSAAALLNWHSAISRDTTGSGIGRDDDIKPEGAA